MAKTQKAGQVGNRMSAAQKEEKNKKKLQASADQEYNALVKATDWASKITERVEIMESLTPDLEVTKEWLTSAKTLIGQTPDNLKAEMSQVVNDKGILLCPCYWPEECHSFFAWLNKRVKKAQTTVVEPAAVVVVTEEVTVVEPIVTETAVSTPVEYKPTNGFAKTVLASVVIADEQVAPVVSNPVKVSYNKPKANKNLTNTKADKFGPSAPSEAIEEAIPKSSSDFLKDALRKAMYESFYAQQQEALQDYYQASKSSIAAKYEEQYKDYKVSLVDAINSVVTEANTIKAKAKQDVILAYEAEEARYVQEWDKWLEDSKSFAINEVLQEVELPIDSSLVMALIEEAKVEEEAAKAEAVKDAKAKADKAKQQQKIDADLDLLYQAKKQCFYFKNKVSAMAAKAIMNTAKDKAKVALAKAYYEAFVKLEDAITKAEQAAGTKEFKALLNKVYDAGKVWSSLWKANTKELGFSFDSMLEVELQQAVISINNMAETRRLTKSELTDRKMFDSLLDELESK
jgi:hypothetical protein